jgi:hypothetical protein
MSEALRLADDLDTEFVSGRVSNHTARKAAAELRRLATIEAELQKAKEHLSALYGLVFAAEQAATNGSLYWEVEEALRAYQDCIAPDAVIHKPSGFVFDTVIAAAFPEDLASLTPPKGQLSELQQAREERTALLVNEQNLREELAALRASLDKPIEQLEAMPMREKEELVIGWFSEDWAISKGLDMLHDYEKIRKIGG